MGSFSSVKPASPWRMSGNAETGFAAAGPSAEAYGAGAAGRYAGGAVDADGTGAIGATGGYAGGAGAAGGSMINGGGPAACKAAGCPADGLLPNPWVGEMKELFMIYQVDVLLRVLCPNRFLTRCGEAGWTICPKASAGEPCELPGTTDPVPDVRFLSSRCVAPIRAVSP